MLAPRTPSTTGLSGIHVANKAKLPSLQASLCILGVLSFTRSANFGSLFYFGQKGTSVTLQTRSAVSANFSPYQGRQLSSSKKRNGPNLGSRDSLHNLEIGTQLPDSKNVQHNLEIAQIPKLRGTYNYNDRIRGNGRLGRSATVILSVCTADS